MTSLARQDQIGFRQKINKASQAIHVEMMVHDLLSTAIHKTRLKTWLSLVTGLINSKELKLTALGRSVPTQGTERSGILRVA